MPRLLDTSTLSHYFGSRARERTPQLVRYVDKIIETDGARISIVTKYELERGLLRLELAAEGHQKRRIFAMFLSGAVVYRLDDDQDAGWQRAAQLHAAAAMRSPAVVLGEADLLILATARLHDLTLVTTDVAFARSARLLGFDEHIDEVPLR